MRFTVSLCLLIMVLFAACAPTTGASSDIQPGNTQSGGALLARLPELCASTGSACHSGTTKMSATLAAMHLSPELARGTVRLSVGWYTSEEDIDRAANLLLGAWEDLSH